MSREPHIRNLAILVLLCALLAAALINAQRVPLTVHHLHSIKRVSTTTVSPRGDFAVYTVRFWNEQSKKATTNIDKIKIRDGSVTRLTNPPEGVADSSPIISPDGKLVAFTRKGQIFYVPSDGTEADVKQLATLPVDVSNLKWSPNGKFIVFSADVYHDCDSLECTAQRDEQLAKRGPNTGIVYDQLYVRHWDVWITPGKVTHLFILQVLQTGIEMRATNAPTDVLQGFNANSPVPPFGGAEQFDISPEGDEIAFTAELITRNVSWTTGWKIYIAPVSNPSQRKLITGYTSARTQQPLYSPDGNSIAFLAMDRPGLESDRLSINLYDTRSGVVRGVTRNVDISFGSIVWLPNSQGFLADADSDGSHKLYSVDMRGQVVEVLNSGHNQGASFVPGTNFVLWNRDTFMYPSDVWRFEYQDGIARSFIQLTNYNKELLDRLQLGSVDKFYFVGSNSSKIQGFLFKPINFQPNKTFPLTNLIHGGPESGWTDGWSYRWNPQLWAAAGYAVMIVNFHGSTGFGQAFTDSIRGNWGGWPYQDIMMGVDNVLQSNSWIDKNRMCSCGASYGGYMIAWINSQTDRFKCLVMHDGVFDAVSMGYATEELWFTEAEFGGTPYDNLAGYEKWNPRRFAKNMNTPTLVIHGGMDFRIPISEGLSMFTALQRRGIPSKLLYFPLENHWVLNPSNSIMWYDNVLGWLNQWTKNTPPQ